MMDTILSAVAALAGLAGLTVGIMVLQRLRRPAGRDLEGALREELRLAREEAARQARELREEVAAAQAQAGEAQRRGIEALQKAMSALTEVTRADMAAQREQVQARLGELLLANEQRFEKVREAVGKQLQAMLAEQRLQMAEVTASLNRFGETSRQEQEKARATLDLKLRQLQEGNEKKLDEMRRTVDEKLHSTLEKRLGESFKIVSERLEAVQRGLGEMQGLATGVGDLKRVLTNVKERGTWGEFQLAAILEEILAPGQFARNVSPRDGGEVVEFAVRLPGRGGIDERPVWLPIDAKFPKEDYERLVEAASQADADQVKAAGKALAAAIQKSAKDIHDKYIAPPATTDFAIMFLPTEGLYAEVLRQPGLHDDLQRKHRVLVAGPTTLSAILSSLRVGFQTLAIEQRAHEVWKVLGAVKTEFGKFGAVLDKVQKQLNTASRTIDESARRTRAMERSLRTVEQLPADQAADVLALPEAAPDDAEASAPPDNSV